MPQSSNPLLSIIESFGEVFWIRSAAGQVVYANQEFEAIYRLTRAQLYRNPDVWLKKVHTDDRHRVEQLWQRRQAFEVEYRLWIDGDTLRWIWLKTYPAQGTADSRQCFVSLHRDITERKQQAERERALNRVIETIRTSLDLETIFAQATQTVGELLPVDQVGINQYLPQQQIWKSVAEYRRNRQIPSITGLTIPAVDNPFTASLLQGEAILVSDTQTCQDVINRSFAESHGGAWLIVPLQSDGQVWGALALNIYAKSHVWTAAEVRLAHSIADQVAIAIHQAHLYQQVQQELTERRRVEGILREQEAFLRSIYESTHTSIFIVDVDADGDFRYVAANPVHEQRIGLTSQHICGKRPEEIMDSADAAAVRRNYQRCLDMGKTVTYEELLPFNGVELWWLTNLTPIFDDTNRIHRIIGTCTVINELKQTQASLLQSRQEIATLVNKINACLGRFRVYPSGRWQFEYISEGSQKVWGFRAEEILNDPDLWQDRVLSEDFVGVILPLYQTIYQLKSHTFEYRYRHPDGRQRWIAASLSVEKDEASQSWVVSTVSWDISDRKRAEQQLEYRVRWERLLRTITEDIRESLDLETILATAVYDIGHTLQADQVLVMHLKEDGSGRVIRASPPDCLPTLSPENFSLSPLPEDCRTFYSRGRPQVMIQGSLDACSVWMADFQQAAGMHSQVVAPILQDSPDRLWGLLIVQSCSSQRHWRPEEASFLQQIANQLAIAIHQSDLYKQLQAANKQLTHLSIHDPLTRILNRRAFDSALEREWQRAMRSQSPLSLILLDIDYFKLYNDYYGHPAGDNCLIQVAQALSQVVNRPGDVVARYGGEEFILLLPDTDATGVKEVSRKIQAVLRNLAVAHEASPISEYITASFGVVWAIPKPGDDMLPLISAADKLLYQAKQQGRNRYRICSWQSFKSD